MAEDQLDENGSIAKIANNKTQRKSLNLHTVLKIMER